MNAARAAPSSPALAAGDEIAWLGLARKWWVLAVCTPSVVLAEVAFAALLFSNTQILQGLDTDMYRYQWATGPYMVLLVVWALVSVRLAASYGSERVFLAGALMTGLGCVIASCAGSLAMIVIGRLFMSTKGLVLSVALSQMWLAFPRRKGLAMGVFNAATYGGVFIGAAFGGFLEFQTSWRTIYAVTGLAFVALAVAGNRALIRDRPAQPVPLVLNALETVLLAVALAGAVFLVFRGQYFGWFDSNLVAFSSVLGALALAGFLWVALTSRDPLVDLRLGNFATLAVILPLIALFGAVTYGMLNTLPSYLNLRGYPSVVEGWIFFIPGVAIVTSCLASGFVYGRKWTVIALWVGLGVNTAGALWFVGADLYTAKETIVAMLTVWAVGAGLVFPTALRLTFSGQNPAAVRQLAGVKMALRFVTTVLGSFAVVVFIQRGTDIGQDLLRQHVTRDNPAYAQVVRRVERHVASRGSPPGVAAEQAGSMVGEWVAYNAQMTGQRAGRRFLLMLTVLAFVLALFIRLRPEASILADDAHDIGWGWGHRGEPEPLTAPDRAA